MFEQLQDAVDQLTQAAYTEAERVFKKSRENPRNPSEQGCLADEDTEQLLKSVRALMENQLVFYQAMALVKPYDRINADIAALESALTKPNDETPLQQIKEGLQLLSKKQQSTNDFLQLLTRFQEHTIQAEQAQDKDKQIIENGEKLLTEYNAAHSSIAQSQIYIQLEQKLKEGNFSAKDLGQLETLVQNAREDFKGAVRVFVRIRAGIKQNAFSPVNFPDTVCVGNSQAMLCEKLVCDNAHIPASQIFLPSATTQGIFNHTDERQQESIAALCARLADGTVGNLVLFGYGYSGSGKTYTLLGDVNQLGLFQIACNAIVSKLHINKKITYICQECYIEDPERKQSRKDANGNIIEISQITQTRKEVYAYKVENENIVPVNTIKAVNLEYTPKENFEDLLKIVNNWRNKTFRVKWTPNNSESSRSHLLFRAQFTANDQTKRELAVLDLAGLEDSNFIFDKMIQEFKSGGSDCNIDVQNPQTINNNQNKWWVKAQPLTARGESGGRTSRSGASYKTQLIQEVMVNYKEVLKGMKQNQTPGCTRFDLQANRTELYSSTNGQLLQLNLQIDRYRYIWQLIDEGFFINKTINELADYLKDMKSKPGAIREPRNFGTTGFCQLLDQLRTNGDHPAKFIMICTINAEQTNNGRDNCKTDIADTIKFLTSIQKEHQEAEEKKEE